MAPVKPPKQPLNSMKKSTLEKPISKSKKHKKKNYSGFSIYIYKIMKQVGKEPIGISQKTMLILNGFVNDMLEKIAQEAGRLAMYSKKNTLSSREIQSAVKLVIPGELAMHANAEALRAVNNYHISRDKAAVTTI